jgi:ankyrin repeat protein
MRELLDADPSFVETFSPDGFTPLHAACFSGGAEAARLLVERGAPLEVLARHEQVRVRPLGTAAFSGDAECAKVLLDAGADPNGGGANGFTPLHTAAANGNLELVRLLLDRGANPTRTLVDGRTAEQLARDSGHDDCAEELDARA